MWDLAVYEHVMDTCNILPSNSSHSYMYYTNQQRGRGHGHDIQFTIVEAAYIYSGVLASYTIILWPHQRTHERNIIRP